MNKVYEEIISADVSKINERLSSCPQLKITNTSDWEKAWQKVLEAEKYALSAGGKRIRPVLAVEFYKLFGGCDTTPDWVYEAACTLEMTHTFSLIHDDMPEMDDDDMRRGKPATHVKFGTDVGLLAGDGLAILPYEILSLMSLDKKISAEMAVKLINTLSFCSGNRGMIAGQMLDLWSEERSDDIDDAFLRKMSYLKTGQLLKASCCFGAEMADADIDKLRAASIYAERIGLAFQIVDDVLDVTSDAETLGKPIGSDQERQKSTFADILGIEGALSEAKRLSELACEAIAKYPNSGLLCELALSLAERNK